MPGLDQLFPTLPSARLGVAFAIALAVLLVLRAFLLGRLHAFSERTSNRLDDLVLGAVRTPSLAWCVAVALNVAVVSSPFDHEITGIASGLLGVLIVGSVTLVAANIAAGMLDLRLGKDGEQAAVSGIGRTLVRGVILIVGFATLLHAMGVAITPILTALGVGGLAVALALQDTLTNFFAGVHILLEKPFGLGQYIRLEGGEEGYVLDIGWRTTRIRTLLDHTVVVPNAKIAGSTIQNMHLPDPAVRCETTVGVSYDADTAHVERALQDELVNATRTVKELLPDPPPDVLLVELGPYAMQYVVRFQVREIAQQRVAVHAVNTRIVNRLRAEKIDIPYPTQTVRVHGKLT